MIEVQAAAAAYGRGRAVASPLLVGSVKNNIGHPEPAAGVAGLIKVVLAPNRGMIPPHLHCSEPNPNLDWDRLPVRVTTELTEWPRVATRPPRAGVSALGISGTNARSGGGVRRDQWRCRPTPRCRSVAGGNRAPGCRRGV